MDRKDHVKKIIDTWHIIHQHLHLQKVNQPAKTKCKLPYSACTTLSLVNLDKTITIKKLSETLGSSSSAATQIVNQLETAGFIKRINDKNDKRVWNIQITPAGQKKNKQIGDQIVNDFEKVFSKLTTDELKQYAELTRKIIDK